jgi:hypothetical protein
MSDSNEICGLVGDVVGLDCTAGGVTSGAKEAVVVWPGMLDYDRVFGPKEGRPLLELEIDERPGLRAGYQLVLKGDRLPPGQSFMSCYAGPPRIVRVIVKPYGKPAGMFGGHWVIVGDSRFPISGPVPVFDRYENEPSEAQRVELRERLGGAA